MSQLNIATMFTEISGSSLEKADDHIARRDMLAKCVIVLTKAVRPHQGMFVKTIGNTKQMWRFSGADQAMKAAISMREALAQHDGGLQIKAGFHFGTAIEAEGVDVLGDAVNTAARVTELAKPGQILTTQTTADLLDSEAKHGLRFIYRYRPKGKTEVIDVLEAIQEGADGEELTVQAPPSVSLSKDLPAELVLSFAGRNRTLTADSRPLTMGRDPRNDLVIHDDGGMVSRSNHCRIEFVGRKFMLIDESTNGTYIYPDGGEMVFLRRDKRALEGSGTIIPGYELTAPEGKPVRFQVILPDA